MLAIRPMLGTNAPKDLSTLHYPMYLSPKLDGVRAIVKDGVVYSRSGKPIPNKNVQRMYGHRHGYDGELIYGSPTDANVYNKTVSAVMTEDGPKVNFYVFDYWDSTDTYESRYGWLYETVLSCGMRLVPQYEVTSEDDVIKYEKVMLDLGYEGVMLRNLNAVYKHGRSTVKEEGLLKVKRFIDSEATILDVHPLFRNNNKAKTDALGYTERSTCKDNLVATNLLGSIIVKDLYTDVEFSIGSGFDEQTRIDLWQQKDLLIGKIVKYKHFPVGEKDKPRFPVFIGFRPKEDIDERESIPST